MTDVEWSGPSTYGKIGHNDPESFFIKAGGEDLGELFYAMRAPGDGIARASAELAEAAIQQVPGLRAAITQAKKIGAKK